MLKATRLKSGVLACALGAIVMIGCSSDGDADYVNGNNPDSNSSDTTLDTSSTTSTTVAATTTTAEVATVPSTIATTKAPSTPTTVRSTVAPTRTTNVPVTNAPELAIGYEWSGNPIGCTVPYNTFFLDVQSFTPGVTVTFTVTVNGQSVTAYGGNTYTNGSSAMPVLFDQWPTLADGGYTVNITGSASGYTSAHESTTVTYSCV